MSLINSTGASLRTPGLYEGISNNEYHNNKEWLSSSQIKVALVSAAAFKHAVIDGNGKKKTSDQKDFGSVVHKLTLEEADFFNEYHVGDIDHLDLRTKHGKEAYENEKQLAGAKILISKETFDNACACRDSIMKHKDARRYLEMSGISEASLYVILDHMLPGGEIVPVKVRVRPDRLVKGMAILDLKTTKNPSLDSFRRDGFSDWGYGYDVSAALYLRAWKAFSGEDVPFIFIAVRNEAPYESAVYRLSDATKQKGNARLDRALNTIILAERAGVWEMQTSEEEI